jgi:hypothetical protein
MDVNKYSTQIERLEVVETGRRRRWSDDEKLWIVLESLTRSTKLNSAPDRSSLPRMICTQCIRIVGDHAEGRTANGFFNSLLNWNSRKPKQDLGNYSRRIGWRSCHRTWHSAGHDRDGMLSVTGESCYAFFAAIRLSWAGSGLLRHAVAY